MLPAGARHHQGALVSRDHGLGPVARCSRVNGRRMGQPLQSLRMDASDNERLVRLERQVDFLFRRLGIDPNSVTGPDAPLPTSLYAAIAEGKMVEAVKIYRKATGAGLLEAKRAVDAIARQAGS